jgi:hypothetical protein
MSLAPLKEENAKRRRRMAAVNATLIGRDALFMPLVRLDQNGGASPLAEASKYNL